MREHVDTDTVDALWAMADADVLVASERCAAPRIYAPQRIQILGTRRHPGRC